MFKAQKKDTEGIPLVDLERYSVDTITKLFIIRELAVKISAFHSSGITNFNLDLNPENIIINNNNNRIDITLKLKSSPIPIITDDWQKYMAILTDLIPDGILPKGISPDPSVIQVLSDVLLPFKNHILTLFITSLVRIPIGTVIYRGQTDAFAISQDGKKAHVNRRILNSDRHTYFGLRHLETTVNYGITARFTVNQPLELLNITDRLTYDRLMAHMLDLDDQKAVKALENAFPLKNGHVIRHSQKRYDFAVLDFICTNTPFEGYIQPRIETIDGGHMHAEMAVCSHKTGKINDPFGQQAAQPPQGETYASLFSDYRMRLVEQQRRAARQQSRKSKKRPLQYAPQQRRPPTLPKF